MQDLGREFSAERTDAEVGVERRERGESGAVGGLCGALFLALELPGCPSVEWLGAKGVVVAAKEAAPFSPSLTPPFVLSEFCFSPLLLMHCLWLGHPSQRSGEAGQVLFRCTPLSLSVLSQVEMVIPARLAYRPGGGSHVLSRQDRDAGECGPMEQGQEGTSL